MMQYSVGESYNFANAIAEDCVSDVYDDQWWTGIVIDVAADKSDRRVNFLHPSSPATSFHWPHKKINVGLPLPHIL